MSEEHKKYDYRLTKQVEQIIQDGDITKSRYRQTKAEKLLQKQKEFRRKYRDELR
jgi:hypothetical protein